MPKYILNATILDVDESYDINNVQYSFKRKIEGKDKVFIEIALTENNSFIDEPFKEGEINESSKYKITYKVIGEFPDGRTLDSMNKNQIIFIYNI